MTMPKLHLTPRRPAVLAGFDSTVDVLIRVAAPEQTSSTERPRAPLHLAMVIDRSGSMGGQPLEEAKKAAAFVITGLAAGDRASIVTYDDDADIRAPLQDMASHATLLRAIDGIHSGGSTNLHGGWFAGAETLAPAARPGTVSRVILLSDGCANKGLTEPEGIYRQCAELANTGVTTSTYGLGRNFNEDLMIGMARAGHGNTYYGQAAADLMDPFREEFALLNALCARWLELELVPAPGIQLKVLNDYQRTAAGHLRLPDLATGGEAWALVRLTVPVRRESVSPADMLTATLRYTNMDGEPCMLYPGKLALPTVPAAAYLTIQEDPLVLRRTSEIDAAQLQLKARAAAQRGDWGQVEALLARGQELAADNPWLKDVLQELKRLAARRDEVMFSKETSFSSSRMFSRLAPAAEGAIPDLDLPLYLRRKGAQGRSAPDPSDKK